MSLQLGLDEFATPYLNVNQRKLIDDTMDPPSDYVMTMFREMIPLTDSLKDIDQEYLDKVQEYAVSINRASNLLLFDMPFPLDVGHDATMEIEHAKLIHHFRQQIQVEIHICLFSMQSTKGTRTRDICVQMWTKQIELVPYPRKTQKHPFFP